MQVDELREALRRHRLSKNMSYEALAADIAETLGADRKLSLRTIYSFIDGHGNPFETTTYTIEQYLKAQGIAA